MIYIQDVIFNWDHSLTWLVPFGEVRWTVMQSATGWDRGTVLTSAETLVPGVSTLRKKKVFN